jgi:hypothetical protein
MGIFDILMKRLRDPKSREVFDSWLERDQCKWQENGPTPAGQPVTEVAS